MSTTVSNLATPLYQRKKDTVNFLVSPVTYIHTCATYSHKAYIHTWSLVTTALQETGGSCVMLYTKFMFYFLLFQFSVTVWLGLSNKLLVKVICKCDTTRYFQVDIFKGNFVVFVTTKTSFFWCVGNLGHLKPCLWCLNWVFWWDSLGNIQPCLRRPKPKIFHRKLGRLQPCLWQLKQVLWMRPLWWTKQEFQAKPWCSPNPKQVLCLNLTRAWSTALWQERNGKIEPKQDALTRLLKST